MNPLSWFLNIVYFKNVFGFARNSKISHIVISVWSMLLAPLGTSIYVIRDTEMRVALHKVLIDIALGHIEVNVKSFLKRF